MFDTVKDRSPPITHPTAAVHSDEDDPPTGLSPVRITAVYVVFSAVWIIVSDTALAGVDVPSIFLVSAAKGLAFVAVTGAVLYTSLRHRERELEHRRDEAIRAADQLRLATQRFEALFARSVVPMFRCDVDGHLLDENSALLDLFAVDDADRFRSTSLLDYLVEPDLRTEISNRLADHGELRGSEAQFRRPDDTRFSGRITALLVQAEDGPVIEGAIEDVTQERRAEDEARFRSVLYEQLPSAVVVADIDRHITGWNARAEEIFGFDADSVGLLSSDALVGTEPGMAERIREQIRTAGRWEGEADIIGPDGTPIPFAVSSTLVRDDDGPIGFSMVFTDLSDTRESRRRLRLQATLLDQVHNAVIATDVGGSVVYWNRSAEEMYGWTAEEALGRPVAELTMPASERFHADEIMTGISQTGSWQGELELTRKNGSSFPALVSNVLYLNADGEPAGVVGVSTDLTRLRQAERQAHRAERSARAVLDSVTFPMAVISNDGEIVDVNNAWTTFALKNNGDVERTGVGTNYLAPARAALTSDPGLADVITGITEVLAGRSPLFTHRYPCHAPNEPRWFEMLVTPIEDVGAVVAHVDLTSEVLAQQVLENTVQEKDQFLATVSHELRTPLTAVLGFSEQLREGDVDPADLEAYYATIADQAREVADLVEDLLLAGRLDTDTITIRPEAVDPSALVRSVIRPWSGTVEFAITNATDDAWVYADPLRARQILRNLVTNAIRHGAAPYEIRIDRQSTLTLIRMIDHGPGIPDTAIDSIYDPYTAASSRHGQPGSVGLGLYVSHRLAQLMDGTLTYRRQDNATIFTIALPTSRK